MKVYISGPITGIDRAIYLSQFDKAEKQLRSKGYDVLNPTKLPPSRWLWIYRLMGYRLTLLYDIWHLFRCDGIVLLEGWQQSRGARTEAAIANIFNIQVITLKFRNYDNRTEKRVSGVSKPKETASSGKWL